MWDGKTVDVAALVAWVKCRRQPLRQSGLLISIAPLQSPVASAKLYTANKLVFRQTGMHLFNVSAMNANRLAGENVDH